VVVVVVVVVVGGGGGVHVMNREAPPSVTAAWCRRIVRVTSSPDPVATVTWTSYTLASRAPSNPAGTQVVAGASVCIWGV